jgi:hypothetical protein
LLLDERQGRRLGSLDTRRIDVVLAHASGDVQRQHDGDLAGRYGNNADGARQRHDQAGQRQEEDGEGEMAAHTHEAGQRCTHQH